MARYRADHSGERRTAGLRVQLTPKERAALDLRAAKYRRGLSYYARLMLLSDLLDSPPPSPRDANAIRELAVEITRVGTNLNQLARIANETRAFPQEAELKRITGQIIDALEKVKAL